MSVPPEPWLATERDVILIASGYDWRCWICDFDNHVAAVPRFDDERNGNYLTCDRCGTESRVFAWEHCYS